MPGVRVFYHFLLFYCSFLTCILLSEYLFVFLHKLIVFFFLAYFDLHGRNFRALQAVLNRFLCKLLTLDYKCSYFTLIKCLRLNFIYITADCNFLCLGLGKSTIANRNHIVLKTSNSY